MLIVFIVYFLSGVVINYIQEVVASAIAKRLFMGKLEVTGWKKYKILNPIIERIKEYSFKQFLGDINSIMLWPFEIVWWIRGINNVCKMNEEEIEAFLQSETEKYS